MSLRVSNLRLGLEESETALEGRIIAVLGLTADAVQSWRILRKSLDSRDKNRLHFVYSVQVDLTGDECQVVACLKRHPHREVRVDLHEDLKFAIPSPGNLPLRQQPIVIGSGPAGLVAAVFLAEHGYSPLVVERGRRVRERIHDVQAFEGGGALDPESNYLFGEGGAGTFSDGKLTCRNSGPDVRWVLELFAECKGKPSIVFEYRPHLGSNRLPAVVKSLRQRIEKSGGAFQFSCRVEDLDIQDGRLKGLHSSSGYIPAQVAILATGHSARDTYSMLLRHGLGMVPKAFQMGVRIEQAQESVNRAQYGPGRLEEKLGAADYALVARGRNDLFTFCMCAGGQIIPSVAEAGYFCTNGMSLSKRASPFANSGLMITVTPEQFGSGDVMAGVRLQATYEKRAFDLGRGDYSCPIQKASDFLTQRRTLSVPSSSYGRGLVLAEISELLPAIITEALREGLPVLDRRWHGRFLKQATLVGPEARGSAPLRMLRDPMTREGTIKGLYPVGEGAGYAGGIVSAAVDGLRSAMAIMAHYTPLHHGMGPSQKRPADEAS